MKKQHEKQDVRILTLCKQHYFDKYAKEMMVCEYSCWGYYDGIKISEYKERPEMLFKKKTLSPISSIWTETGKCITDLDGTYSKQNIGIFRPDKDGKAAEFWSETSESPYFAAGFIQLEEPNAYKRVKEEIEEKLLLKSDPASDSIFRKALVYYTLDNTDLIVLMKCNSLQELGAGMDMIEEMEKIIYVHSVFGISEAYLNDCECDILGTWKGINCHIDDALAEITLKIVSKENEGTIRRIGTMLKAQYEKNRLKEYKKAVYSYVQGHENIVVSIPGTNVKSLLALMIKDGFVTHANPLYGNWIYNIETEVRMKLQMLKHLPEIELEDNEKQDEQNLWCGKQIKKYEKKAQAAKENNEEGLYSYYRGMIQSLNTMMQYEGFFMSQNIFYLLFPALEMFDRHLIQTLEKVEKERKKEKRNDADMNELKEVMKKFLTAVNSIVYHTVHTDQMFLMVPGYSGTSYSIPIKLCLMYMGVMRNLIRILNDKSYEYNCLLVPEMEGHPESELLQIGEEQDDRLILFHASQRSLYRPRHFLLILTHEIAHYVGTDIRNRQERAKSLISSLSRYMAETILPEQCPGKFGMAEDKYERLKDEIKPDLYEACNEYLTKAYNASKEERKDHARLLEEIMRDACQNCLANEVGHFIRNLSIDLCRDMKLELLEASKLMGTLQSAMDTHRIIAMAADSFSEIVREALKLYREVFSDLVAISILDCNRETYLESFDVSEGSKLPDNIERNDEQAIRSNVMESIFEDKWGTIALAARASGTKDTQPGTDELVQHLFKYMRNFPWLEKDLKKYADCCKKSIEQHIKAADLRKSIGNDIKRVRDIFRIFADIERDGRQISGEDIYDDISSILLEYTKETRERYQEINSKSDD